MMSWVSLLFESILAALMVALIVYCIKLNRRLALLRNQNAEFADMMTGLQGASERAEQAVHHLKAVGLSAERSLRSVIGDAAVAQADLARLVEASSRLTAAVAQAPQRSDGQAAQPVSPAPDAAHPARRERVQRDMLMDALASSSEKAGSRTESPGRPRTREEAEETVLQAIRSARVGT